jgi:hypothetical protein
MPKTKKLTEKEKLELAAAQRFTDSEGITLVPKKKAKK